MAFLLLFELAIDQDDVRFRLIGVIQSILSISLIDRFLGATQILITFINEVVPLTRPRD